MTYKDFIEAAYRRDMKRKGTVIIAKIFNKEVDGEWEDEKRRGLSRKPYDKKYAKAKLRDYLLTEANSNDMNECDYNIDDKNYIVVIKVIRKSKKCDALLKYGFEIVKDLGEV